LKEQVALLIELQKLDSIAAGINLKKRELPEKISESDNAFRVFLDGLEAEKTKVEDLQKHHKDKEEKLKRGIESIKKSRDRLYEVKTNKEYQAILSEIETIEKKNSQVEDEIIVAMEALDEAREQLKAKEEEHAKIKLQYEQNKTKMEEELRLLDTELLACQKNMDDYSKQIQASLLKRYETIKEKRNGLAVVSVWKEVCDGCHVNIPPQQYIELQRSTELMSCPNCNRIIYYRNQDENNG
jgi:predicted  nucleic acid-binding Zn-ribbon protein